MATTGADIIGQSIGGLIYTLLGAPMMFLFNGISYIFSAVSEGFIKIPKIEHKNINITFKEDFVDGLKFILGFEGLVRSLIMAFFINFLFGMIRVLIIPWFLADASLGMAKYGLLNGFQSVGLIIGTTILSFINIKPNHKYRIYIISLLIFVSFIGLGAAVNNFIFIIIFFTIAYGFLFISNTVANSTIMMITPPDKRGKVFAAIGTIAMAISPIGNFVGGVLCEFIGPRTLIIANTIIGILIICAIVINPKVKKFLNYNPEKADR